MSDLRTWDAWNEVHQNFEVEWWRKALARGHYKYDADFVNHWTPVREFIKPSGRIIDIGCGPRPPFTPCVAIDHAHGWRAILDNMRAYALNAGPAARVAISTDFHPQPFDGHPGFERDEFMVEIDRRFIITDTMTSGSGAHRAWAGHLKPKN